MVAAVFFRASRRLLFFRTAFLRGHRKEYYNRGRWLRRFRERDKRDIGRVLILFETLGSFMLYLCTRELGDGSPHQGHAV